MKLSKELLTLFAGSEHRHGVVLPTTTVRDNGKREVKYSSAEGPATEDLWEHHIAGRSGLGVYPIRRGSNDVRFGAIDIDSYQEKDFHRKLATLIEQAKLPMVLCLSKSGGAHIYLFCKDWVPAKTMVKKLSAIAAYLGYGSAEIFPAQSKLEEGTPHGNFINMPYYNGIMDNRYALDSKLNALSVEDFVAYAKERVVTISELEKLEIKLEAIFEDGPPCLNCIFSRIRQQEDLGHRNTILFQCAVYAHLRWPGEAEQKKREDFILAMNNNFSQPLPLNELLSTILRRGKDAKLAEYKYQCSRTPLREHCDSLTCKNRKYGIGAYNAPSLTQIQKLKTEPPIWLLNVNGDTLRLESDELIDYTKFSKKIMEATNVVPPLLKKAEWQVQLNELLKNVKEVEVSKEYTPTGMAISHIFNFLSERSKLNSESKMEDLNRSLVHVESDRAYFRLVDIYDWLASKKFNHFKQHQITDILVHHYQATEYRPNISPRPRAFSIPKKYTEEMPQ